jgi:hypothetical protein
LFCHRSLTPPGRLRLNQPLMRGVLRNMTPYVKAGRLPEDLKVRSPPAFAGGLPSLRRATLA